MQQYRDIKSRHADSILFFRMGDFFEMFYEDAEIASKALGLTLTTRNNGGAAEVPLAGVPVKAAPEYLRRLVEQGYRVAVCDQVEDPKSAKGIVRREVIETVTPGAAFSDEILDGSHNNYICAFLTSAAHAAIAAVDISTGEFRLVTAAAADAPSAVGRFAPREVIIARGSDDEVTRELLNHAEGALITEREQWEFDGTHGAEELRRQFRIHALEGLGIQASDRMLVGAGAALVRYLKELQPQGVPHLALPVIERPGSAMPLDEMTVRNLELVESLRGGAAGGTLVHVLDRTGTPMGGRLLRSWLVTPLLEKSAIDSRMDATYALFGDSVSRAKLRGALEGVRDIERLASKCAAGRATPRELGALASSLARLVEIGMALSSVRSAGRIDSIRGEWDNCDDISARLLAVLTDDLPMQIGDQAVIARGVDAELDSLRELRDGGKDSIARIQAQERAATGIQSLKVGYNRVFGYFIEVSNANRQLVPPHYQRRQTLTGGERYITPELKEYEERVLSAAERIEERERQLFEELRSWTGAQVGRLQQVSRRVAELDVLASFAEVAAVEGYTRPDITDGCELQIIGGRHPVVERMMPREKFIPNDVTLDEDARVIILTGPNMSGKSTVLRQTGLLVLMAQIGSMVPAASARIGVVDRVFTRVGASDNLVRGQSTFMVEMTETSAILRNASRRSLVLLDEIGRGTSTYDGVSIAWAVSEHLHNCVGCKTIFATHYHELTLLAEELPAVRNFNVEVREVKEEVLFLHKLLAGPADRSYGIEVGRLAGLPPPVLRRARAVLKLLEGEGAEIARALRGGVGPAGGRNGSGSADGDVGGGKGEIQLGLFADQAAAVMERLRELDTNQLTPLEALTILADLSTTARKGKT
jgi:DNA mismatch repair protein MutS